MLTMTRKEAWIRAESFLYFQMWSDSYHIKEAVDREKCQAPMEWGGNGPLEYLKWMWIARNTWAYICKAVKLIWRNLRHWGYLRQLIASYEWVHRRPSYSGCARVPGLDLSSNRIGDLKQRLDAFHLIDGNPDGRRRERDDMPRPSKWDEIPHLPL
jgi:hypothetical protein